MIQAFEPMTAQSIEQRLELAANLIEELQASLDAERIALTQAKPEPLELATQRKRKALDNIEPQAEFLASNSTKQAIAALPAPSRQILDARHNAIMTAAHNAKESNAVNGKILARSQQSLLELVQLMAGVTAETTYSDRGQVASAGGPSAPRAQA